jgi:hypothetical protein
MLRTTGAVARQADEPSVAVVMAVAAREGVDPTELSPPLNDVVDPDALDALFAGSDDESIGSLTFDYRGYSVEVRSDGRVHVER